MSSQGRMPHTIIMHTADCQRTQRRPQEIALQAVERGLAPGQQRAERGQEKQQQATGMFTLIEEGRPDRDLVALHPFRKTGNSVPHRR